MEQWIFFLIGSFLLVNVHSQDAPPLKVVLDNPTDRYVQVGATDIQFICRINREPMWAMTNPMQFVRQTADGETVLTSLGKLMNAEPSHYDISVGQEGDNIVMQLTILTVRERDDGRLICRVIPEATDVAPLDKMVEVWVIRPLTGLTMEFDSLDRITESRSESFEVDAGVYKVKCIAEGSNPGANSMALYLHGDEIEPTTRMMTEPMEGNPRRFRSWMEAEVHIGHMNTGHDLECTASSRAGDNHAVKIPIKVNTYDPVIECDPAEAYRDEKYPTIVCHVHVEELGIKNYKFELGESGQVVEAGQQSEDFAEVLVEEEEGNIMKVTLKLYKAYDRYFETDFYLLTEDHSGYVSKSQAINIVETEGPSDSASSLVASVVSLVLAAVCAFLQSL